MSTEEGDLTQLPDKPTPSLLEYLETFLPFKLPRLSLPQTAKNLDKALGGVVLASGEARVKRIERGSRQKDAEVAAQVETRKAGSKAIAKRIAMKIRTSLIEPSQQLSENKSPNSATAESASSRWGRPGIGSGATTAGRDGGD